LFDLLIVKLIGSFTFYLAGSMDFENPIYHDLL